MALLLKDREAGTGAAQRPPDGLDSAGAPDFACETCGAAMARGQDWCLECGTAAPGRLDARPGWRAAFTVVGVTTTLLLCAVVAAYAALTGDAERSASTAPTGSAQPITAQTPGVAPPGTVTPGAVPVQPGATGPNTTAPPAAVQTTPIIPVKPPPATANVPVTPPPAAGTTAANPSTGAQKGATGAEGSTPGTGSTAPAGVAEIAFAKDAAKTYNQPARAGAEFGPAKYAIDGKPATVWDVVVPADGQPIGAGLVIDLGKPHALRSLRLATTTPGFTVEVYGAKSAKQLPTDVIDKRWIHLTDRKAVEEGALINLRGKGEGAKIELLLLHFTTPGNPSDPRVAIGDVTLRGTP